MAEIMAALFFAEMRFDPKNPHNPDADRFILSKGHAAPILYAAWAEAGAFDRADLLKLRQLGSDLLGVDARVLNQLATVTSQTI